jgi:GH25 family lysozyme M1 (1,4-beta-N-acetylmuramidase)
MSRGRARTLVVGTLIGLLLGTVGPTLPARAAPSGYPISGIDVSAFQGQINWSSVATGGALFAYIRASEQANIPDQFFAANYQGAKANGLFAGAYHRARPELSSGRSQADYFLDQAQYVEDGRTLPPMLDIEWPRANWPGLDACYNMTPAQMTAWIRDFVNRVRERTGKPTMIYTNTNWWRPCTNNDPSFGSNPLFISGYLASPPPLPAGWTTWTLWQYSDSGALPGDQDVFNGDYAALTRLAGGVPAQVALRARANNRFVTAENAGSSSLIANRTVAGQWEQFEQVDAGGGYIALRSNVNGRFVTAENGGALPLIANRTAIGPWERFRLINNADGTVSLLANANGRYVTAENGGALPLIANRTAIGPWEQFDLVPPSVIGLRAEVNGRYVTAENGGALPLIANRAGVGPWERFDRVDAGGGYVALRSHANGRYVTAEDAGAAPLIANRTAIGAWEKFRLVTNADGTVSLLANANGRYVTAENAGAAPLIANRTVIGLWEKFRVTPG